MRVVWLVSVKEYKKDWVPQVWGALTHGAHTVTPHSTTQQVSALLVPRVKMVTITQQLISGLATGASGK